MKRSNPAHDNSSLRVSVYWGDILYDTAICGPNEAITVGRGRGNTFILDTASSESLKLVEVNTDRTADLYFNDGVDGHVRFGKELLSFQTAKKTKNIPVDEKGFYHVKLSEKDRADFLIGHVSFYLDWVKPEAKIPVDLRVHAKRALIGTAMLGILAALIFFLQAIEIPPPEKPPERLVTILPPRQQAKAAMGETKTADGGAAQGPTGKAEVAAPEKPSIVASLQKANLGSLVSGLASLGANAPSANANKAALKGAVQQPSTGGLSTEGLKTGAGGHTVGIGRAVGKGEGGFEGTGRLGLSGNSLVEGGTGHGDLGTQVEGGLDQDVIESVIRRRQDRIRLCYVRQLNFYPKLSGKVAVHFVIGKAGQVIESSIAEDTMKNAAVRSCILAEVKSWTFPAPEGGTLVKVDYPFVFESSAKGKP